MIAFLGMGLLGSNFVRALRRRGEEVRVWSRSAAKARALEAVGAVAFDTPGAAVRGATRIHLALSDDAAVDDVLAACGDAIARNAAIVDHTTTSPAGATARAAAWEARAIAFQHAPVFMGPQNALDATGTMLASGPQERFDAVAPALRAMCGTLVYLGPDPGRAAAIKLLGNSFFLALTAGLTDVLALGAAMGITGAEVSAFFEWFMPGGSMTGRLKRLREREYDHPSWTLAMARKDARLMLEAAARGGGDLIVTPAVAAAMDRLIAEGRDADDWTVLARDATR